MTAGPVARAKPAPADSIRPGLPDPHQAEAMRHHASTDPDDPSPYSQRGFEVSDGWFPLLRTLVVGLEEILVSSPDEVRTKIRCSQVKEKFVFAPTNSRPPSTTHSSPFKKMRIVLGALTSPSVHFYSPLPNVEGSTLAGSGHVVFRQTTN